MNRLAELLGSPEPTLAVPFTSPNDVLHVHEVAQHAHVAELRADLFANSEELDDAAVALKSMMPVLLTVRHQDEGGGAVDDSQRGALYRALRHQADGLDIELHSRIRDQVIEMAHEVGAIAIVSYHNFEATPMREEMDAMLDAAAQTGADYIKFALRANDNEEYGRQVDFLRAHYDENIIMVAMSDQQTAQPYGPLSRSFFPSIGSRLSYASIDQAVAPGQLTVQEQAGIYRTLYGQS